MDTIDDHDNFIDESKTKEIRYKAMDLSENEMQKRSQLFYELMKARRSVRCFSSHPVPLKLMQNLIKTAGFYILNINNIITKYDFFNKCLIKTSL